MRLLDPALTHFAQGDSGDNSLMVARDREKTGDWLVLLRDPAENAPVLADAFSPLGNSFQAERELVARLAHRVVPS